jgi:glycosyltransferase involved in cell wall biosynthesis
VTDRQPAPVSVVIPVYNGVRYLAQAIESALGQTRPPQQVIVIDDGSDDGSVEAARVYGGIVESVSQPRAGAAAARNEGIRRATAQFVAFLDADDVWEPAKLERQLAAHASAGADILFTHVTEFRDTSDDGAAGLRSMAGLIPSTAMIRRSAFERIGGFNPTWRVGEFIDWYMRAMEGGLQSHVVSEMLVRRRVHGQNTGQRDKDGQQDYARLLKAALDRRRRAGSAKGATP